MKKKICFTFFLTCIIGFIGLGNAEAKEVTWDDIADRYIELVKVDGVTMNKKSDGIDISLNNPVYGAYTMNLKYDDNQKKITYTNTRGIERDNDKRLYYFYVDEFYTMSMAQTLFDVYRISTDSKVPVSPFYLKINGETKGNAYDIDLGIFYESGENFVSGNTSAYDISSYTIDLNTFDAKTKEYQDTMTDDEYNDFDLKLNLYHATIKLYKTLYNPMMNYDTANNIKDEASDILDKIFQIFGVDVNNNEQFKALITNDNTAKTAGNIQTKENPKTGLNLPIASGAAVLLVALTSLMTLRKKNLFRNI